MYTKFGRSWFYSKVILRIFCLEDICCNRQIINAHAECLPFFFLSLTGDDVVPRSEWNARPPKWVVPIDIPVKHVMIAHTVTPECYSKDACASRMREMQNYHMSLGKN